MQFLPFYMYSMWSGQFVVIFLKTKSKHVLREKIDLFLVIVINVKI